MWGNASPSRLTAALVLALSMATVSGCSWTGSLFGSSDSPEEAPPAAEQQAASASQDRAEVDIAMGAEESASASSEEQTPEPVAQTPQEKEEPKQEESRQQVAAVEPATPEAAAAEEEAPEVPAKGRVPIERPESTVETHTGDIEYRTSDELLKAVQKAVDKESFLGYTEPFDAFPVLEGVDTMSAAFVPVEFPHHKIFYHAFYQPSEPFHKQVYGYTVIDMRSNQDFGHFDGNADGVFEQKTLDPKIVIDDYVKASQKPSGQAQ